MGNQLSQEDIDALRADICDFDPEWVDWLGSDMQEERWEDTLL